MADPTEKGVAMSRAMPQVMKDPAMKISAPVLPPPAALSMGSHRVDPRNSPMEWPNFTKVSEPLKIRNAPMTTVSTMT